MKWGLGEHSGAGIDQIWKRSDATTIPYLIVEAKAPDQILRYNPFAPDGVNTQMSKEWIVDRLARMQQGNGGELAQKLFKRMSAESFIPDCYSQATLGIDKSYYPARASTEATATVKTVRLQAVTATAVWTNGPSLSAKLSPRITDTDLL
jgi:hypothetical protein